MSETDESETGSLVPILASELYPKMSLVSEDDALSVPFPTLCGESVQHLGRTSDGVAALSNFRFFVRYSDSFVNIPLGLIDSIECRDIFFLYIYCKDARSVRCTFSTNESCVDWYKRLGIALTHPTKLTQVFAFAFYAWCLDARSNMGGVDDVGAQLCVPCEAPGYSIGREIERLGFDLKLAWRISYANEEFKLCGTYPMLHLVPSSVTDKDMESVASFRTSRRFPSVVWRDMRSGAVLVRSSQPEVGWLGWRSAADENLLENISKACLLDPGTIHSQATTPSAKDSETAINGDSEAAVKKMLIVDARSYAAAVANRAKGGGVECSEYYPNCEIQFMNLANIHTIRKSFHALRALCSGPSDQPNWLSLLENTKWHVHISGLMRAALIVVNTLDKEGRPVLVHCSDGWDRTPQITALSELFLDPYYRTIDGFRVLVEKEWLEFGHKFADRCGHGVCTADTNERCPVFLQFLDCVHQTLKQFPCAFQFNEAFLVKLVQHTYSCLFGTFLGNHTQARLGDKVPRQTCSVWSLLQPSNTKFKNYLYTPNAHMILRPSYHMRHMFFWSAVYLSDATETMPADSLMSDQLPEESYLSDNSPSSELDLDNQKLLTKTRSCDNINVATMEANLVVPNGMVLQRRLSDPNIVTDPTVLHGNNNNNTQTAQTVSGNDSPRKEEKERDTSSSPEDSSSEPQAELNKQNVMINSPSDNDVAVAQGEEEEETASSTPAEGVTDEDIGEASEGTLSCTANAPVPQAISDREILKHSHDDDCSSSLGKRSSSETAIETSTDTLTGDLDQGASVSGDLRAAAPSHQGAAAPPPASPSSPRSEDHEESVRSEGSEEDDEDDKTCELTPSINGLLPLERSIDVSTSTTDISDSHVLGGAMSTYQQQHNNHHKGVSVSSPNMNSMSLRLDNLLKLHIPDSSKMLDFTMSQQSMVPTQSLHVCGSSRDSETYTPPTCQSRTPSSSSPTTPATEARGCWRWAGRVSNATCALDQDGLVTWMSTGQVRLIQMEAEYQTRIEQLQRQLHITRQALSHYATGATCTGNALNDNQDNNSLADSQESGERASSLTSDMSWEPVEEKDAKMTLWVPDHAVTHCAGCDVEFWIVRRRHHCRNCGHVFCNDCTSYSIPVPQQQLNTPVRVCRQCFLTIISENPAMAPNVTTCNGGSGFTSVSVSQVLAETGQHNGGFPQDANFTTNHFTFSNGHGPMVNGGNASQTCGGAANGAAVHAAATSADRSVTVTSS